MYEETLAPGLSAGCQLVLTHAVLLYRPAWHHISFTQTCQISEGNSFYLLKFWTVI